MYVICPSKGAVDDMGDNLDLTGRALRGSQMMWCPGFTRIAYDRIPPVGRRGGSLESGAITADEENVQEKRQPRMVAISTHLQTGATL